MHKLLAQCQELRPLQGHPLKLDRFWLICHAVEPCRVQSASPRCLPHRLIAVDDLVPHTDIGCVLPFEEVLQIHRHGYLLPLKHHSNDACEVFKSAQHCLSGLLRSIGVGLQYVELLLKSLFVLSSFPIHSFEVGAHLANKSLDLLGVHLNGPTEVLNDVLGLPNKVLHVLPELLALLQLITKVLPRALQQVCSGNCTHVGEAVEVLLRLHGNLFHALLQGIACAADIAQKRLYLLLPVCELGHLAIQSLQVADVLNSSAQLLLCLLQLPI
mmetsp:Transcript_15694/g.36818  ORF Transcript_15694/g.36818 Transcript_15694/m.36818 type:complete len:271 (-) Transcript_15694:813-1625(-)